MDCPVAAKPFYIELLDNVPPREEEEPVKTTIFFKEWSEQLKKSEDPVAGCIVLPNVKERMHVVLDRRLAEIFQGYHRSGLPFQLHREKDLKLVLGNHNPLVLKGEDTEKLHQAYNSYFTKERIDSFKKPFKEMAREHAMRWREKKSLMLLEDTGRLCSDLLAKIAGYETGEDMEKLVQISLRLTRPPPSKRQTLEDFNEQAKKSWVSSSFTSIRKACSETSSFSKKIKPATADLSKIRGNILSHIKKDPKEGTLIGHLISQGYSAEAVQDLAIAFFLAGLSKFANLLAFIIAEGIGFEEALQAFPVGLIFRKSGCDMQIKGENFSPYTIRKGEFIQIAPSLMEKGSYIFGGGVHKCEGEILVRELMPVILAALKEEAEFAKPEAPSPVVMENTLRYLDDFKIDIK